MTTFETSRRSFLATLLSTFPLMGWMVGLFSSRAWAQDAATSATTVQAGELGGPFSLPPLPYAYSALEPYIDEQTMRLHHDKHHAAYVKKLNAAVQTQPELANRSIEQLLTNLEALPQQVREEIRNQGGGHYNHTLFWEIMTPGGSKHPTGELAREIDTAFGNFEQFQKQFEQAGEKRFGSGWVWLVRGKDGKLQVISTPNQDTPLSQGLFPVMGNDVWEHAYYLKYQNRRGEYLKAWWNVLNWDKVARRWEAAAKTA